jgi:fructokinase
MNSGLCIFGEVLFDHFPDGKRVLGGAPFNVAWHLQAFGEEPYFISRVGIDREAEEVRTAMRAWGMDVSGLQTDTLHTTGQVRVSIQQDEPSYDIVAPAAYDAIAADSHGDKCKLLYHGSLALRNVSSRDAMQQLKACSPQTVFVDVNLRAPWWEASQVLEMVRSAQWVKLNSEELAVLYPNRNSRC